MTDDRRRELQQYRYLPRDTFEAAGFVDEGNFLDGHKIVYSTDNGYKFRVTTKRYVGRLVTCPELGIEQSFSVGTRWELIAAWIDARMTAREAAY